jgi:hypothetical protein
MAKLQNCWEFMKCGFGPDNGKTRSSAVCAAAREIGLNSVHGGMNGGRACWFVDNTRNCGKGAQGDFSDKYPDCINCRFYWKVREEVGNKFEISLLLNTYLHNK